ncbi:MAG TPA: SDR family oxidoreductase [Candidatus Bathyarchaeia archaeon]|nr:SDR family oxidoreductase [Candidatus Bathyarchaeia archaeon]
MAGRLQGKIAFVTGGASGLGAACAARFLAEGAKVTIADLSIERDATEGTLRRRHLDVTDEAAWQSALAESVQAFGRLDVLVNAAGISLDGDDLERCTPETWRKTLAVNLDGVFLGCKHGVALMKSTGGGSIINFASILAKVGDGGSIAYTASKGGVRLLTRSTAAYCNRNRLPIRCNAVCPGYFETPMLTRYFAAEPPATKQKLIAAQPSGRLGQAEELTGLLVYLASDESRSCTGADFVIDGGFTAA